MPIKNVMSVAAAAVLMVIIKGCMLIGKENDFIEGHGDIIAKMERLIELAKEGLTFSLECDDKAIRIFQNVDNGQGQCVGIMGEQI